MIRVLHIIDHLGLGGAQSALLDFLSNMDGAEVSSEVAVMHGRGVFAEALERAGFRVHSLSPGKWPPAYIPALFRLLGQGRFDILHFHLPGANWLAKPLASIAGDWPRISHDHTSGNVRFRGYGSLLPDTLTHFFSSRIIAVSDGVGRFLRQWECIPADQVTVIPNGVDTTAFQPAQKADRSAARSALGLPTDTLVVGAMGRLAHEKNFSLLPKLAAAFPEVQFVIGGSGPQEELLRQLARTYSVEGSFHLLGSISDRGQFFRALDIFILPSLFEGLPMSLLEAMASGVPLLASRLEDIALTVEEEKEGLLATAGDEADFRHKLERLIAEPGLRASLAAASLEKVRARYSALQTARQITALYRHELTIAQSGATGTKGG